MGNQIHFPWTLLLPEMNIQCFSPWPFLCLQCFLLLILVKIQPSLPNPAEFYRPQFICGNITAGFPFWEGEWAQLCGHPNLEIRCEEDIATMKIGDANYRVLDVDQEEKVLSIARQDYFHGLCPRSNTTIDEAVFNLSAKYENLTLFMPAQWFQDKFHAIWRISPVT